MLTKEEYNALDKRAQKFVSKIGLMAIEDVVRKALIEKYIEDYGSIIYISEYNHYLEQRLRPLQTTINGILAEIKPVEDE